MLCHQAAISAADNSKGDFHMTDSTNDKTAASKAPSHTAYHVRNRSDTEAFWTRIGSAWPHADGKGFNIQIETVPLDGRISLRIPSEKTK
jgi:hypothetical protein